VGLRGGFFTDTPLTATSRIAAATYQFYLADDDGPISHNGGNYSPFTGIATVTMVPDTGNFANGTVNGAVMELAISPDPATYAGWASQNFPEDVPPASRLPDADANQDGIPNLIAYTLRLDPMAQIHDDLPRFQATGDSISFRFRRNKTASDLVITVQSSITLDDWDTAPEVPAVIITDPDGDGGAEMMEIQSTITAEIPKRFFRLKAALN